MKTINSKITWRSIKNKMWYACGMLSGEQKRQNVVVENVNDEETNSAEAKSINTISNRSIQLNDVQMLAHAPSGRQVQIQKGSILATNGWKDAACRL